MRKLVAVCALLCTMSLAGAPTPLMAQPAAPTPASDEKNKNQEQKPPDPNNNIKIRYRNGFELSTADDRFAMRIAAMVQFRYTYVAYDHRINGNQTDYSNFYMRRARLWFDGHAYSPRLTYSFHIQLEPNQAVNAHDLWIEYQFHPLVSLGVGRNKIAYGVEFLNSGTSLNFIDRSVMYGEADIDRGGGLSAYPDPALTQTGLFGNADSTVKGYPTGGLNLYRSQGAQLSGRKERSPTGLAFEYQAGIWQNRGSRGISNSDNKHFLALRTGFYPMGWIDWKVGGDMDYSKRPRVGVVLSTYHNSAGLTRRQEQGYNVGFESRYRGFSGDVEWATEHITLDKADLGGAELERRAWRASFGYFLKPKFIELVGRYAEIERMRNPTPAAVDSTRFGFAEVWNPSAGPAGTYQYAMERQISEVTGGLNIYLSRSPQYKVFIDASRLTRGFADFSGTYDIVKETGSSVPVLETIFAPDDQHDTRLRTMIQLKF